MNRRKRLVLAAVLLVMGLAMFIGSYLGNLLIGADATTLTATELNALGAFRSFGLGMIGSAVLLFLLLGQVG